MSVYMLAQGKDAHNALHVCCEQFLSSLFWFDSHTVP